MKEPKPCMAIFADKEFAKIICLIAQMRCLNLEQIETETKDNKISAVFTIKEKKND